MDGMHASDYVGGRDLQESLNDKICQPDESNYSKEPQGNGAEDTTSRENMVGNYREAIEVLRARGTAKFAESNHSSEVKRRGGGGLTCGSEKVQQQ
ncbi:hypothetical protein V500_10613 [Pseudogymnoascus sp. VKM F-4518 (FW-2643)]|nr:hypothetical protein V500_10613 [Pseudogymnoascus sp. VKM F-4518 (FW-2643)]